MKKRAMARRLAKELQISTANAADQIDTVVHNILEELKRGQHVEVPGLGVFRPGGVRPRFQPKVRRGK